MKKIVLLLFVLLFVSSCFEDNQNILDEQNDNINEVEIKNDINEADITNDINIDNEIKKEEEILNSLEQVNEKEIDELINSIIE